MLNSFRPSTLSSLALASALGAALLAGCGTSDDAKKPFTPVERERGPLATVNVTAEFPDEIVQGETNSVHVFVIVPGDSGVTCADLVGGAVDPYDPRLGRLGDFVSKDPYADASGKEVGVGKGALIYVEAVDYTGAVTWAGCVPQDVKQPTTNLSVPLTRAGVFDCAAGDQNEGRPCDDEDDCTVGDQCEGGDCQAGRPRDCTHLNDGCTAGTCEPGAGCVATPAPDGRPCEDGEQCTTGDSCIAGACVGNGRNCAAEALPCQVATGACNSITGACEFQNLPYGTSCDDGMFCTDSDRCDSFGSCSGTSKDCGGGGCAIGTCNEVLDQCVISNPLPLGSYCNDSLYCTSGELCDGLGQCVGTPMDCTGASACSGSSSTCVQGCACDETYLGCRPTYLPANTPCDDGSACTVSDRCSSSGTCSGTYATYGTPCDDGTTCTTGEFCDSFGGCTASTYAPYPTPCSSQCFTGSCSGAGSCSYDIVYVTSGTPCDDGNPSTVGDYCSFGTCYGGSVSGL